MTYKAEVAKWLAGQRPGVVTIDDLVNATGALRQTAASTLGRLAQEPSYASKLIRIGAGLYEWNPGGDTPAVQPEQTARRPSSRRPTDSELAEARTLYEAGATEREVARAMGIGSGTAHRWRVLIEEEQVKPAQPQLPLNGHKALAIVIQPSQIPGHPSEFRYFHAEDGRHGTLWFHNEA